MYTHHALVHCFSQSDSRSLHTSPLGVTLATLVVLTRPGVCEASAAAALTAELCALRQHITMKRFKAYNLQLFSASIGKSLQGQRGRDDGEGESKEDDVSSNMGAVTARAVGIEAMPSLDSELEHTQQHICSVDAPLTAHIAAAASSSRGLVAPENSVDAPLTAHIAAAASSSRGLVAPENSVDAPLTAHIAAAAASSSRGLVAPENSVDAPLTAHIAAAASSSRGLVAPENSVDAPLTAHIAAAAASSSRGLVAPENSVDAPLTAHIAAAASSSRGLVAPENSVDAPLTAHIAAATSSSRGLVAPENSVDAPLTAHIAAAASSSRGLVAPENSVDAPLTAHIAAAASSSRGLVAPENRDVEESSILSDSLTSSPFLNAQSEANAHYIANADDCCKKLVQASQEGVADGWMDLGTSKDVHVMKKAPSRKDVPLNTFKGSGNIQAPPEFLLRLLLDPSNTSKFDEMLKEARIIRQVSPAISLVQLVYKAIWPTSPRDLSLLSVTGQVDQKTWISSAFSVVDDEVPAEKGHVRAHLEVGGYVILAVPDQPEQSQVTYVACVDLKGNIPLFVVNKVTSSQPMCVKGLRTLAEPLYQDMKMQPQRMASFKQKFPIYFVVASEDSALWQDTAEVSVVCNGSIPLPSPPNLTLEQRLAHSTWHFNPSSSTHPLIDDDELSASASLDVSPGRCIEAVQVEQSGFATPPRSHSEREEIFSSMAEEYCVQEMFEPEVYSTLVRPNMIGAGCLLSGLLSGQPAGGVGRERDLKSGQVEVAGQERDLQSGQARGAGQERNLLLGREGDVRLERGQQAGGVGQKRDLQSGQVGGTGQEKNLQSGQVGGKGQERDLQSGQVGGAGQERDLQSEQVGNAGQERDLQSGQKGGEQCRTTETGNGKGEAHTSPIPHCLESRTPSLKSGQSGSMDNNSDGPSGGGFNLPLVNLY